MNASGLGMNEHDSTICLMIYCSDDDFEDEG